MKTALLTVKLDAKVKQKAQKTAADLGFSLSALVNGYIKSFIRTKTVHFDCNEEPSDYLVEALREADEERKRGEGYTFIDPQEAIKFLDDVRMGKVGV